MVRRGVVSLPPLVAPTGVLGRPQLARYARQVTLPELGTDGQRRLAAARVLVIGAGGLGAPVLLYLAAAGVGTLGIVDDDVVEASNLHRQVIHSTADIGRSKIDSARDAVSGINPDTMVEGHHTRLTADNAVDLFARYDLVVDGTDNFATRYLVADAAEIADKPYVWGSILRFQGQVSVFWASHGPTYRDLFPEPPPPGSVPSCAEGGVLGVLPGTIGMIMATEAIKLLTGIGEPLLGRLLLHDALTMSYDVLPVRPDPTRTPTTNLRPTPDPDRPTTTGDTMTDDRNGSEITAQQLRAWLDERTAGTRDFVLVDVREPFEREINNIAGSVPIPMAEFGTGEALDKLDPQVPVVLYCKAGGRSARCLEVLHARGRADAVHLGSGIDGWVAEIEPDQPTY